MSTEPRSLSNLGKNRKTPYSSLLRNTGLFSSLGESAKLRGQIGGFPEKAPYAGLETGAPREN
uniref:Uncharacterized protein n=1 Tax=Candidatus Kentrum sp. FM TaxID=2126340 RepID=A0A450TYT8_9GAMM|nr:MAG: hypothetical protein BECKFM1743C_GA0114222_1008510 [Candidatus Kentron sp. FM]VFJ74850.1 MAG: hypothetical protein BECKFM1743A_GA0114220_108012 [Candidatus Kentron sp. FM]VFK08434.1 MAG: hypothetical protein BECKFM1743B_GA0114221_100698 [Candidatus Kentron sp. FM]